MCISEKTWGRVETGRRERKRNGRRKREKSVLHVEQRVSRQGKAKARPGPGQREKGTQENETDTKGPHGSFVRGFSCAYGVRYAARYVRRQEEKRTGGGEGKGRGDRRQCGEGGKRQTTLRPMGYATWDLMDTVLSYQERKREKSKSVKEEGGS